MPGLLCGARVAGQVYDADVAAHVPALGNPLAKRAELEDYYDTIDPTGDGFLTRDQHNFHIQARAIDSAHFATKSSWWTGGLPNLGRLKLRLRDGTQRKFILAGRQDRAKIQSAFRHLGIRVVDS